MQPMQKAGDPSMEDILASIRKIIADDPSVPVNVAAAAPRPTASPAGPGRAAPQSLAPAAHAEASTLTALERDLADLLRDPVVMPPPKTAMNDADRGSPPASTALGSSTPPPAAAEPSPPPRATASLAVPEQPDSAASNAAAHANGFTAWLRGRPNGNSAPQAPVEAGALSEPSMMTARVGATEPNGSAARDLATPAPVAPASTVVAEIATFPVIDRGASATDAATGQAEIIMPAIGAKSPAETPAAAQNPEPWTAPAAPASNGANGATHATPAAASAINGAGHAGSMQSILELLGSSAAPSAMPLPAPVMSRSFATVPKPEMKADVASAPANRADVASVPRPALAPMVAAAEPARSAPAAPLIADEPATASTQTGAEAWVAAGGVGLSDGGSESSGTAAVAPLSAVARVAAQVVDVPVSVAQSIVAVQPMRAAAPALAVAAANPTARPESTLDDTLAELLRPMVRQWLDQNMMRALEKAVRVEMTESVMSAMAALTPEPKD